MKYRYLLGLRIEIKTDFVEGLLSAALKSGVTLNLEKTVIEYLTKGANGLSEGVISDYQYHCENEMKRLVKIGMLIEIKTLEDSYSTVLGFIETSFKAASMELSNENKQTLLDAYKQEKRITIKDITDLSITAYPHNFVVWTKDLDNLRIVYAYSDVTGQKILNVYENE